MAMRPTELKNVLAAHDEMAQHIDQSKTMHLEVRIGRDQKTLHRTASSKPGVKPNGVRTTTESDNLRIKSVEPCKSLKPVAVKKLKRTEGDFIYHTSWCVKAEINDKNKQNANKTKTIKDTGKKDIKDVKKDNRKDCNITSLKKKGLNKTNDTQNPCMSDTPNNKEKISRQICLDAVMPSFMNPSKKSSSTADNKIVKAIVTAPDKKVENPKKIEYESNTPNKAVSKIVGEKSIRKSILSKTVNDKRKLQSSSSCGSLNAGSPNTEVKLNAVTSGSYAAKDLISTLGLSPNNDKRDVNHSNHMEENFCEFNNLAKLEEPHGDVNANYDDLANESNVLPNKDVCIISDVEEMNSNKSEYETSFVNDKENATQNAKNIGAIEFYCVDNHAENCTFVNLENLEENREIDAEVFGDRKNDVDSTVNLIVENDFKSLSEAENCKTLIRSLTLEGTKNSSNILNSEMTLDVPTLQENLFEENADNDNEINRTQSQDTKNAERKDGLAHHLDEHSFNAAGTEFVENQTLINNTEVLQQMCLADAHYNLVIIQDLAADNKRTISNIPENSNDLITSNDSNIILKGTDIENDVENECVKLDRDAVHELKEFDDEAKILALNCIERCLSNTELRLTNQENNMQPHNFELDKFEGSTIAENLESNKPPSSVVEHGNVELSQELNKESNLGYFPNFNVELAPDSIMSEYKVNTDSMSSNNVWAFKDAEQIAVNTNEADPVQNVQFLEQVSLRRTLDLRDNQEEYASRITLQLDPTMVGLETGFKEYDGVVEDNLGNLYVPTATPLWSPPEIPAHTKPCEVRLRKLPVNDYEKINLCRKSLETLYESVCHLPPGDGKLRETMENIQTLESEYELLLNHFAEN